jgi:hypothetical protein
MVSAQVQIDLFAGQVIEYEDGGVVAFVHRLPDRERQVGERASRKNAMTHEGGVRIGGEGGDLVVHFYPGEICG